MPHSNMFQEKIILKVRTPTTSRNEPKVTQQWEPTRDSQAQITTAAGLTLFATVSAYSRSLVGGGSTDRCRIYGILSFDCIYFPAKVFIFWLPPRSINNRRNWCMVTEAITQASVLWLAICARLVFFFARAPFGAGPLVAECIEPYESGLVWRLAFRPPFWGPKLPILWRHFGTRLETTSSEAPKSEPGKAAACRQVSRWCQLNHGAKASNKTTWRQHVRTEHVLNLQTKGPISEPKAAPATRKTQHRPGSNCFFVQKEIFECFGREAPGLLTM